MDKSMKFNKKMSAAASKNQAVLEHATEAIQSVVKIQGMRLAAAGKKLDYIAQQDKLLFGTVKLQQAQSKTIKKNQAVIATNTRALDKIMKAGSSATTALSKGMEAIKENQNALDGIIEMIDHATKNLEATNADLSVDIQKTFEQIRSTLTQPIQMMCAVFVALLGATAWVANQAFSKDERGEQAGGTHSAKMNVESKQ